MHATTRSAHPQHLSVSKIHLVKFKPGKTGLAVKRATHWLQLSKLLSKYPQRNVDAKQQKKSLSWGNFMMLVSQIICSVGVEY